MPDAVLASFEITSPLLSEPRKLWVQPALSGQAADCVVFLDAELYMERVRAPEIMQKAQTAGQLGPVNCVYVSNLSAAARHVECICNNRFTRFLTTDLLGWMEQVTGQHERIFLAGLSLSGLAAAFAVLRHPELFSGALCQSPSAWWNREWLAGNLKTENHPGRFWISVGDQELTAGVAHPPTGLLQKTSQLESVRRLAAKMKTICENVHATEYAGGHDPACWAAELPVALAWLLR